MVFEAWKVFRRANWLYDSRRFVFLFGLIGTTSYLRQSLMNQAMNFDDYGEDHPHTLQEKQRRFNQEQSYKFIEHIKLHRKLKDLELIKQAEEMIQ